MSYVINTWITRGTPWILKIYSTLSAKSLDELPEETDPKVVEEIINVVSRMKVKVNIPHQSAATPRYYLVILNNVELVDIIGIKRNLTVTKWSYNYGYWHPQCQIDILNTLKKKLQQTQEVLEVPT